jgi:hypothetical protein
MSDEQTVLIVGLGELGGLLLELLARSPTFRGRIVGSDVNADLGLRKVNSARQGAICWGIAPRIDFAACDLSNVDAAAEMIAREKPTLIVNCTTLATWWLRDLLPAPIKAKLHAIGAGSGLWAPGHAALAYALMRAVRSAGSTAAVINSSYPDAVNPALARAGLAPLCGVGNGDLLVAPLTQLGAADLGVSAKRVRVTVVAHHFHAYNVLMHGNSRGSDFFVRIMLDSDNVTGRFDLPRLLARVPDEARIPGAAGATWIVAASAMRTMEAFLTRSGALVHVPGPAGLVGGWPVTLGPPLALALPQELTHEQASAINEGGQRAEGIERFEADGTMVLGEVAVATLRDVFGFSCARYPLPECLAIARELTARLRELGEKHGIALKVH